MNRPPSPLRGLERTGAKGRFTIAYRARSRLANAPQAATSLHLVLAYRPGWQSVEDLKAIAANAADIDPQVRTFIVPSTHQNAITRKSAGQRPSLIVSPGWMTTFKPRRGKIYQGRPIPKAEEVRRLAAAGVAVPRTAILTPDLKLDPVEWGEFVLLKPTDIGTSSHGRGINLVRTHRVRYIPPRAYPSGHPGRIGPMMVQQYVHTGARLTTYRVLTLFGTALYAQLNIGGTDRLDLGASDAAIEMAKVALQSADTREAFLIDDADVLAIASAAYEAIPEIPLQGCDILRDAATGALYVIELNCGGNTWHFSSNYSAPFRKNYGEEYERKRREQFDAMRTAARVLVEKTNAEAV